jgi:hypothetical protein
LTVIVAMGVVQAMSSKLRIRSHTNSRANYSLNVVSPASYILLVGAFERLGKFYGVESLK